MSRVGREKRVVNLLQPDMKQGAETITRAELFGYWFPSDFLSPAWGRCDAF